MHSANVFNVSKIMRTDAFLAIRMQVIRHSFPDVHPVITCPCLRKQWLLAQIRVLPEEPARNKTSGSGTDGSWFVKR